METYRIVYPEDRTLTEKEVKVWALDTVVNERIQNDWIDSLPISRAIQILEHHGLATFVASETTTTKEN